MSKLTRSRTAVAALSGLLLALVLAGSTSAAALRQPDGWVRFYATQWEDHTEVDPTPWKGDGIYNTTGQDQTTKYSRTASVMPGNSWIFNVKIENDGPIDRFRVQASGTGGWEVSYFRGTTDITSAIVAGTYKTPFLSHGETVGIKVKLAVADPGTRTVRLVTIMSLGDPSRVDSVRIKSRFVACGC